MGDIVLDQEVLDFIETKWLENETDPIIKETMKKEFKSVTTDREVMVLIKKFKDTTVTPETHVKINTEIIDVINLLDNDEPVNPSMIAMLKEGLKFGLDDPSMIEIMNTDFKKIKTNRELAVFYQKMQSVLEKNNGTSNGTSSDTSSDSGIMSEIDENGK